MRNGPIKKKCISDSCLSQAATSKEVTTFLMTQIKQLPANIEAVSFAKVRFVKLSVPQIVKILTALPIKIAYVELFIIDNENQYAESLREYSFLEGRTIENRLIILEALKNKTIVFASNNQDTIQHNEDDEIKTEQYEVPADAFVTIFKKFPLGGILSNLLCLTNSNITDALQATLDIATHYKESTYYAKYLEHMTENYLGLLKDKPEADKSLEIFITQAIESRDIVFKKIILSNQQISSFILSNYICLAHMLISTEIHDVRAIIEQLILSLSDLNQLEMLALFLNHPKGSYLHPIFMDTINILNRPDIQKKILEIINKLPSNKLDLKLSSSSTEDIFKSLCDELDKVTIGTKSLSLSNVQFSRLTTDQIIDVFQILASKMLYKIEISCPIHDSYNNEDAIFNIFIERNRQDIEIIFDTLPKDTLVSLVGYNSSHKLTITAELLVKMSNRLITKIDFLYIRDIIAIPDPLRF